MTSFKDAVEADIKSVFINALEFASEHQINGSAVNCVVDADIIEERKSRGGQTEYIEGVFNSQLMIFVATEDLPTRPVRGEILRLDNKRYMVDNVSENMGVLEITIEANDT